MPSIWGKFAHEQYTVVIDPNEQVEFKVLGYRERPQMRVSERDPRVTVTARHGMLGRSVIKSKCRFCEFHESDDWAIPLLAYRAFKPFVLGDPARLSDFLPWFHADAELVCCGSQRMDYDPFAYDNTEVAEFRIVKVIEQPAPDSSVLLSQIQQAMAKARTIKRPEYDVFVLSHDVYQKLILEQSTFTHGDGRGVSSLMGVPTHLASTKEQAEQLLLQARARGENALVVGFGS